VKPDHRFTNLDKAFWASVRSLSQEVGYTARGGHGIKVPTVAEMRQAFENLELNPLAIEDHRGKPTALANHLAEYFQYRAEALQHAAPKYLMKGEQARSLFEKWRAKLNPTCPLPMNKQKGEMKLPAFLTGLVNMMVEHHSGGADCDYDPRKLTTITRDGAPLRTLARRVDGAFPNSVNPVAIWEIKEYYYTTTFGSRVADGVYETLLDGLELEELRITNDVDVKHYLMIDAYQTWWVQGKAYLCRIVDMLNMGYVDEVLFGREVVDELPRLVAEWVRLAQIRKRRGTADPPAPF